MGMGESFVDEYTGHMDKCINEVMDATWQVLGGGQMVLQKALEWVFRHAKIRKAAYRYCRGASGVAYQQEYFWIHSGQDEFVLIDDYGKSLETDARKNRKYDGLTVCLIRRELFEKMILDGIRNLGNTGFKISSTITKKVSDELWWMLMDMRIIYEVPRSDSGHGRPTKKYPVFQIYTSYDDYNDLYMKDCIVRHENVVQINVGHPYIEGLLADMEEVDMESIFDDVGRWNLLDADQNKITGKSILTARQRFLSEKSFFKK